MIGRTDVITKSARGESAAALRREASVLFDATHPGVVEIVDVDDQDDAMSISLLRVEGTCLADLSPRTAPDLIAIALDVATTMVELHRRGIRHGGIRSDHVIVEAVGRTVLCGFGSAARVGEPQVPTEVDDVGALGRMVVAEVERSLHSGAIADHDQFGWAIQAIAQQAATSSEDRPSTMLDIAERFGRLAEGGPDAAHAVRGQRLWRADRRLALLAVGLVTLVLLALSRGDGPRPTDITPGPRTVALSIDAEPQTPPDAPDGLPEEQPPTGQGQPDPTLLRAAPLPSLQPEPQIRGGIIALGNERWALGDHDDLIVIGDWRCTGERTPSLVRNPEGEVFVFSSWADAANPRVTVTATTVVPNPTAVDVVTIGDCDVLSVVDESGRAAIIAPDRLAA